ncbi:helix-turn-helix transcriptional regulator, partial [Burkholderia gladioli]|nr:helix-turn-helix transcriptional regulator [Burkholderia gladioli]
HPGGTAGPHLSARETEVLRVISRGASNKEAAQELTMSPSTVRTHVENVFRKLDCSTRAAATQGPIKGSAFGEAVSSAAWHDKPSYYIVSQHDRMIPPSLERSMPANPTPPAAAWPTSRTRPTWR